jgi:transaldolase
MMSQQTSNSSIIGSQSPGLSLNADGLSASRMGALDKAKIASMATMTHQQLYEMNPLTAIDLNTLPPSLLTKLLSSPNTILTSQSERD